MSYTELLFSSKHTPLSLFLLEKVTLSFQFLGPNPLPSSLLFFNLMSYFQCISIVHWFYLKNTWISRIDHILSPLLLSSWSHLVYGKILPECSLCFCSGPYSRVSTQAEWSFKNLSLIVTYLLQTRNGKSIVLSESLQGPTRLITTVPELMSY